MYLFYKKFYFNIRSKFISDISYILYLIIYVFSNIIKLCIIHQ